MESEKASLLHKDTDQAWPAWRLTIVIATTCFYVTGIMPVALFSPLVPAFEEDVELAWSTIHSGLIMSLFSLSEALGLVLLGWLSDVYGGPNMLLLSQVCVSVMLGMIARQRNPAPIIVLIAITAFVRGIVWPAATKSMNSYLRAKQWEVGLCLIGLASRIGDLITSELTGLLEVRFGWRGAVNCIAGITVSAVIIFWLIIWKMRKMREGTGTLGTSETETGSTQVVMGSRWDNLKAFYSDMDTLVLLALACFSQPLWVWGSYVATFAHGVYEVSASNSALANGSYPLGQAISLVVTVLVSFFGGNCRKGIYLACTAACVLVSMVPIIFLTSKVSFTYYIVLCTAMGMAVGTLGYVPTAVWCMHFARRNGHYALYCGSLYFVPYAIGALTSYTYGRIREVSEQLAFQVDMSVTTVCLLACGFCLALHTHRQWDGPLFK